MGRSLSAALAVLLLAAACKDKAPPPPAPSAAPPPSASPSLEPLPERPVSGEVAFDLVGVPGGAALAFGAPGGGVRVALLEGSGTARGEPIALPTADSAEAEEIAVVSLESRVGVAWSSRSTKGGAVFAALGDSETRAFGAPYPLTESTLGDPSKRGTLALAVSDKNEMIAVARGPNEACRGDASTCAAFRFHELGTSSAELRGLPMSVPSPCSTALAGFDVIRDRWHYGFCSQASGAPSVTTFMRQLTPFYVGVSTPAPGCTPTGATRVGSDMLFVLQCGDARRGVRMGGMESIEKSLDLSKARLECALGRPRLVTPGAELTLDLSAPLAGLGVLLPTEFGGPNARAVWTGTSLLVASWMKRAVVLKRWECRAGELTRTG